MSNATSLLPRIVETFGHGRESKRHFKVQLPNSHPNATVAAWLNVTQGLPWTFSDPLRTFEIIGAVYESWLKDHACAPLSLGAHALTMQHPEISQVVLFRDVASMAECVARGVAPIAFGFPWRMAMEMPNQQNGFVQWEGKILGGGAVAIVGVDEHRGFFRIMANRGRQWGQLGRAWLSFDDVTRILNGTYEAWTIIPEKNTARRWGGRATLSEIEKASK
jgi:hypothetical protein